MSDFIEWSVWSLTLFIETRLLVLLGYKQVMWMQFSILLTKWFILMCCDTFEEQIPCKLNMWLLRKFIIKALPYFTLGKCLIELVRDEFDIGKVQGECPLDCNLLSIILHSFLFMSFPLEVSHIKVFNEAISI